MTPAEIKEYKTNTKACVIDLNLEVCIKHLREYGLSDKEIIKAFSEKINKLTK